MEFTPATEVWRAAPLCWERAKENEMSERIYRILLLWLPYANEQFAEWDGRPGSGHFFGGNFWYCSDTAANSLIFAVMAKLGEYDENVTGIPREVLKMRAIMGLRYAGFTHDVGPSDCVRIKGINPYCSEKKWGGQGDNFFMASQNGRSIASLAHAAMLLWDDMDDETKMLVQNMVSSYADRWCDEEPRNGTYYDTQCEENAWTSAGIAAGLALFPDHPHHAAWKKGFIQWSISSVTTYKDRLADPSGLIDTPAGNRIKTVTFHPDFTTENHAFVHPSYLCAGTNLRAFHATLALMSGQEVLDSALHNNVNLYEHTVKIWAQFDGLAVPVQGQDWWYNRQHERQLTHAILNVLHHHPDAARLERSALDSIERIQQSNSKGCLLEERGEECVINLAHAQFARDLEPGSALDLTKSYLLHVFGGAGVDPSDQAEMISRLSGVYEYPYGNIIVHRTKETFTSFSWRNNVMALSLPKKGLWSITPLYASFTGTVQFEEPKGIQGLTNESIVRDVIRERIIPYEDGFGAVVTIARGDRELLQDVAFVALPNGKSIYVEQFHADRACKLRELTTGLVGVRNESYKAMSELAPGERTLYFASGAETFQGFYGKEPDLVKRYSPQGYVNIDNEIGYLIYGSAGITYRNKHEYPKWKGVEDVLILNDRGAVEFKENESLKPFIIIAMPNQTHEQTALSHRQTTWLCDQPEHALLLELDGYLAYIHFQSARKTVIGKKVLEGASVSLYRGNNSLRVGQYEWSDSVEGNSSGYLPEMYRLESNTICSLDLDINIVGDRITILNVGSTPAGFMLIHTKKKQAIQVFLEIGMYAVH
jgi:hypothetical protein